METPSTAPTSFPPTRPGGIAAIIWAAMMGAAALLTAFGYYQYATARTEEVRKSTAAMRHLEQRVKDLTDELQSARIALEANAKARDDLSTRVPELENLLGAARSEVTALKVRLFELGDDGEGGVIGGLLSRIDQLNSQLEASQQNVYVLLKLMADEVELTRSIQVQLRRLGCYFGPIDGVNGSKTTIALAWWMDSIGFKPRGKVISGGNYRQLADTKERSCCSDNETFDQSAKRCFPK